jgi:mono/diheme cytochrome c family protein
MHRALTLLWMLLPAGCAEAPAADDTEVSATEAEDTEAEAPDGEALYSRHCASCHGADGTGGTERGIVGELHHSDEELVRVILEGDGEMPAVDVTAAEAQAIVDWMRATLSG